MLGCCAGLWLVVWLIVSWIWYFVMLCCCLWVVLDVALFVGSA